MAYLHGLYVGPASYLQRRSTDRDKILTVSLLQSSESTNADPQSSNYQSAVSMAYLHGLYVGPASYLQRRSTDRTRPFLFQTASPSSLLRKCQSLIPSSTTK